MCRYIDSEHVMPGWICCTCQKQSSDGSGQYNGIQRLICKQCQHARCPELSPDCETGKGVIDRLHHRGEKLTEGSNQ